MAEHAHQPLPRLALLIAQGAAEIGEHQQLVWQSALAKIRAAHSPAAHAARKCHLRGARRLALEAIGQTQLACRASQQLFLRPGQQSLPCAIDQPQPLRLIERKDRDFDFRHHRPQQGRGFHGVEPLLA